MRVSAAARPASRQNAGHSHWFYQTYGQFLLGKKNLTQNIAKCSNFLHMILQLLNIPNQSTTYLRLLCSEIGKLILVIFLWLCCPYFFFQQTLLKLFLIVPVQFHWAKKPKTCLSLSRAEFLTCFWLYGGVRARVVLRLVCADF